MPFRRPDHGSIRGTSRESQTLIRNLPAATAPPQSDLASAPAAKIDPADGYLERMVKYLRLRSSRSSRSCLERMVKYVPAEIIAFQQELVVERPRLVDVLAG